MTAGAVASRHGPDRLRRATRGVCSRARRGGVDLGPRAVPGAPARPASCEPGRHHVLPDGERVDRRTARRAAPCSPTMVSSAQPSWRRSPTTWPVRPTCARWPTSSSSRMPIAPRSRRSTASPSPTSARTARSSPPQRDPCTRPSSPSSSTTRRSCPSYGLDILGDARRAEGARVAAERDLPSLSPPIQFIRTNRTGYLSVVALRAPDGDVVGYLSGSFAVDDVLEAARDEVDPEIDVAVFDDGVRVAGELEGWRQHRPPGRRPHAGGPCRRGHAAERVAGARRRGRCRAGVGRPRPRAAQPATVRTRRVAARREPGDRAGPGAAPGPPRARPHGGA